MIFYYSKLRCYLGSKIPKYEQKTIKQNKMESQ